MPQTQVNRLTDRQCRLAAPKERDYALYDGRGLILSVSSKTGRKFWRVTVRVTRGGQKLARTITLGEYPMLSLADARKRRDEVVHKLRYPYAERRNGALTLAELINEWWKKRRQEVSQGTIKSTESRLKVHLLPAVGQMLCEHLTAPELYAALQRIAETSSANAAHHCRIILSQVLRFGVAQGVVDRDFTVDFRGQLPTHRAAHYPAPTDTESVAECLRALWSYYGRRRDVEVAMRILPYVFVRVSELLAMRWSDVDLEAAQWCYTVPKTGQAHIVPLARQAVELLRTIPQRGDKVFGCAVSTIESAYQRLFGGRLVTHSWRAIARTWLEERLGYPAHVIEMQLAHRVRDPLGRAYNRTQHLDERRTMMQEWADYLDGVRDER